MGEMSNRRTQAQHQRDAALRRISRVRRWVLVAAAGLTAAIAAVVSAAAPGRSLGAKSKAAVRTAAKHTTGRPKMPPLASAGALGLQGPSQAPQPARQPAPPAPSSSDQSAPAPSSPPVTSGGS